MEEPSESGDKFKEIFDLCDIDKDGYIDVKHFVELAKDNFGEGTTVEVGFITVYVRNQQSEVFMGVAAGVTHLPHVSNFHVIGHKLCTISSNVCVV